MSDEPWVACETADEKHMAWVTDGKCTIALVGALDPDTANQNARLIAASPDILAAAKLARETLAKSTLTGPLVHAEVLRALDEAIAKAEGEARG